MIALANAIARDARTDGCAARREIATLSARAQTLVEARRVPAALRAPLLNGVGAVRGTAPPCIVTEPRTTPAPSTTPAVSTTPAEPERVKVKRDNGQHGKQEGDHGQHGKQEHDHGHKSRENR